jgi:hypothetical protein
MALYADGSYQDVLAQLTDGLSWASGWSESWCPPSKSAIFQARSRLGAEPLAALFARVARPLATPSVPGAFVAGRRLVAIDGTCLDVADTVENARHFGRPGVNKGEQAAFPTARVVALAECSTHAIVDAVIGTYSSSETRLAAALLERLGPGMLLVADRGFYGFHQFQAARATGCDLLWRVKSSVKPRHEETLADGSWLGGITPSGNEGRRATPVTVRVIDYEVADGRDNDEHYRLFTTLLDPTAAPASTLASAYAQRWEIESTFDELKTHQRGPKTVLRSKSPELVRQEIWGHLCCHYAIRTLMWEAAERADEDPDRVSFVAALRIARRSVAQRGAFPPEDDDATARTWRQAIVQLLRRLNPARRHRSNPHVIKRVRGQLPVRGFGHQMSAPLAVISNSR